MCSYVPSLKQSVLAGTQALATQNVLQTIHQQFFDRLRLSCREQEQIIFPASGSSLIILIFYPKLDNAKEIHSVWFIRDIWEIFLRRIKDTHLKLFAVLKDKAKGHMNYRRSVL